MVDTVRDDAASPSPPHRGRAPTQSDRSRSTPGEGPAAPRPATGVDRSGAPDSASPARGATRADRAASDGPTASGGRSRTRVDGGGSPGDREAAGHSQDQAGERARGADERQAWSIELPRELAAEWRLISLIANSGEAEVWLAEGIRQDNLGQRCVIKIYRQDIEFDEQVMREVMRLDPAHVVRLFRYQRLNRRQFEILEYIENGALDQLIREEGPQLDGDRVDQIIEEVCEALGAIHSANIVHRDIKPGNILVRTRRPLDLVLTDFGIASNLGEMSHVNLTGSRTQAYAAPEASFHDVSRANDWWSLGIILVEIITGRHPFLDGSSLQFLPDGLILRRLSSGDVEELVVGVPERWLQLCRGLLRRTVDNRWGYDQVHRWVGGDRAIEVAPEEVIGVAPFRLAGTGRDYSTLGEVAQALADHWPQGVASLGRGEIQSWLARAGVEDRLIEEVRQIDQSLSRQHYTLNEALFRTVIALDPRITPSFRGFPLTDQGLTSLSTLALEDEPAAVEVLQELFERDILSIYTQLRGVPYHADVSRRWRQQLEGYALLAPLVPSEAREILIRDLPWAVAAGLRAVLSDQRWSAARRESAAAARLTIRHVPQWFRTLEARIATLPIAAVVGLLLLRPLAESEAAAEAQRRMENRALNFTRTLTATRLAGIVAVILLALFGIATLLGIR